MLLRGLETRLLRVRRRLRQAAARRDPPRAVQVVPRAAPTRRRCRPESVRDHGGAGRRHADHPAEAVEGGGEASSRPIASVYRQVNGVEAPPPISAGWTFCDPSAGARRGDGAPLHRRLLPDRARPLPVRRATTSATPRATSTTARWRRRSTVRHRHRHRLLHEPPGVGHARAVLREDPATSTRAPATSHFVGVFSYAGMPYDEAERNLRFFAKEVMPELQKLDTTAAAPGRAPGRREARRRPPRLLILPLP